MAAPPWFAATMTVRNNAPTLRASLDSITPQLEEGGELTVVDAASTDGTWELLQSVAAAHPRVRVRSLACNRGTGRGLAVAMSTAPIVLTTVDADNRYAPHVLVDLARRVRDSTTHDLLLAVGLEDRDPSSSRFYAWRRSALLAAGGFPDRQYMEEDDLLLRAMRAGVRIGRCAIPHVAEDLKVRPEHHAPNLPLWRRHRPTVRAARKFQWFGFRFPEFARLLWWTRRGGLRFAAGLSLSAWGYVRGALARDPGEAIRPTDFDYGLLREGPFRPAGTASGQR